MSELIRVTVTLEAETVEALDNMAESDMRTRTSLLRKVLTDVAAQALAEDADELTA